MRAPDDKNTSTVYYYIPHCFLAVQYSRNTGSAIMLVQKGRLNLFFLNDENEEEVYHRHHLQRVVIDRDYRQKPHRVACRILQFCRSSRNIRVILHSVANHRHMMSARCTRDICNMHYTPKAKYFVVIVRDITNKDN